MIDNRNTWKDPDPTRCVPDRENIIYDWSGTIRCMCPAMHPEREMAFGVVREGAYDVEVSMSGQTLWI